MFKDLSCTYKRERGKLKTKSLIKSFTFLSFLAFFIMSIILVLFINQHMKNDRIKSVKETVHMTLHYILESELTKSDIMNKIKEDKVQELNKKFYRLINDNTLMGIKILNNKNEVVYSLYNEEIRSYFNENIKLQDKISDKKSYKIINQIPDKSTSHKNKASKLLLVYLPITINNSTVGTYEVYKSYDEIEAHIRKLAVTVSSIVVIGLMILYLLLLRIVYDSSKTLTIQNQKLMKNKLELQKAYDKLNLAYKNTIRTLSEAIDARDSYTAGHSKRVAEISIKIGKELGFNEQQLELLELSALFHDIGKLGIKDSILLKTDKLTDEEFNIIKQHPVLGVKIISNIDFLRKTQNIILHHHEKFGGGGYPQGISGKDIPLEARIITVADSYDAMTSDRPYKKALSHAAAVKELIRKQNIQFDKNIVEAFLRVYGNQP